MLTLNAFAASSVATILVALASAVEVACDCAACGGGCCPCCCC